MSKTDDINFIKNFKSGKKISEILHEAADKHLNEDGVWGSGKTKWSCIAILNALTDGVESYPDLDYWKEYNPEFKIILEGLKNMGLKTYDGVGTIFQEENSDENQQRRYSWLKFAAMLAEEQGV